MEIKNKKVLITGGSTGIGRAMALEFIKRGAKVTILGLNKPKYNCDFHKADISKEDEIKKALEKINSIDILINNAGIAKIAKLGDTSTKIMNEMIDVNFKGLFWTCKYSMPKINSGGCIVNISSLAGINSFEGYGIYCATKAAVISLTKTLAIELKDRKIRANSIAPGIIETEIWEKMYGYKGKSILNEFKKETLASRAGRPEEIAHAAVFLIENEFINGTVLSIDGGEIAL